MTRTDDDSWDVTESVGQTALGVAMARAEESASACPLFSDPYAQIFLDAAASRCRQPPKGLMADRIRSVSGYAVSRTKWFDEFFIAAGAAGIEQLVILAAGLDARAWRLPWVDGSVVYEIDQPQVLEFKTETLRAYGARPAARYVAVPVDLRQDWAQALYDSGFDPAEPSAWSAEGLLPYLPSDAQKVLFERIAELSAPGSRVAVEAFADEFFTEQYRAQWRARMQKIREEAARAGQHIDDPQDLWFVDEPTDVVAWLSDHGFQVDTIGAAELMERYHRQLPPDLEDSTPPSQFIIGIRQS